MSEVRYGIEMLENVEEALSEIFKSIQTCYALRGCRQVIDAIEDEDPTKVILALREVVARANDSTLSPEFQAWQSDRAARFISDIEKKIYQLVMVS